MQEITRPTVMEINLSNLKHNIGQIKKQVEKEIQIMPIIKANAYGTNINKRLEILNQFEIVGVAIVDEGVALRNLGYKKEIFVLNQPAESEIQKISENNLIIGLSSIHFLKEVKRQNKQIRAHLEIETGMGRTGLMPHQIDEYIKELKNASNIKVEGIYSHLSTADIDKEYTEKQIEIFDKAIEKIQSQIHDIKYIHISASNGIINYPSNKYNLVRAGMIMYGYESGERIKDKIDLRPVCKLKSKITFLKEVEEGTSISYGRTFITKRKSKIATIPIGYADGLRRNLSNKGYVVINKKRVPIVGSICMDGFMADVTDLEDVEIGDDVYIWDNEIVTVEEIANLSGTINYEILCTISERVPRIYQ